MKTKKPGQVFKLHMMKCRNRLGKGNIERVIEAMVIESI